jgi:hypothetical protein
MQFFNLTVITTLISLKIMKFHLFSRSFIKFHKPKYFGGDTLEKSIKIILQNFKNKNIYTKLFLEVFLKVSPKVFENTILWCFKKVFSKLGLEKKVQHTQKMCVNEKIFKKV